MARIRPNLGGRSGLDLPIIGMRIDSDIEFEAILILGFVVRLAKGP